jgi:hypothetical protein
MIRLALDVRVSLLGCDGGEGSDSSALSFRDDGSDIVIAIGGYWAGNKTSQNARTKNSQKTK